MATINFTNINRKLAILGESIRIRHYSGTTNQYDSDQNPLNTFTDTVLIGLILEPSKLDLMAPPGLITKSTKKIEVPNDTTVSVSDDIIMTAGTLRAIEVQAMITRTLIFANELSP